MDIIHHPAFYLIHFKDCTLAISSDTKPTQLGPTVRACPYLQKMDDVQKVKNSIYKSSSS
jgi:hypothetical protein